jgi:hypothetical protein
MEEAPVGFAPMNIGVADLPLKPEDYKNILPFLLFNSFSLSNASDLLSNSSLCNNSNGLLFRVDLTEPVHYVQKVFSRD